MEIIEDEEMLEEIRVSEQNRKEGKDIRKLDI